MQVTDRLTDAAIARRSQIIQATIEAIADVGYQRASFVVIAKRAQISSTRLISYHFADRDDLMAQVAAQVIGELGAAVEARVRAADSPSVAVRGYIEANVQYMDNHRPRISVDIAAVRRRPQSPRGSGFGRGGCPYHHHRCWPASRAVRRH